MIRTVIAGASGRMGTLLIRLLPEFPALSLSGAFDQAGTTNQGRDAGTVAGVGANGVLIGHDPAAALRGAQLLIDFTHASATAAHVEAARAAGVGMLLGTTGWQDMTDVQRALERASHEIAVLPAANTSLGVVVLAELVRQAARALGDDYDIEIIETHHRMKVDAPSGTALALGAAAAAGRGAALASLQAPVDRHGARRRGGQIGIASLRGGDVVGEHEVQFLGQGERVMLRHSATDRSVFARGALKAAQWLAGRSPGCYQMTDVLALES